MGVWILKLIMYRKELEHGKSCILIWGMRENSPKYLFSRESMVPKYYMKEKEPNIVLFNTNIMLNVHVKKTKHNNNNNKNVA